MQTSNWYDQPVSEKNLDRLYDRKVIGEGLYEIVKQYVTEGNAKTVIDVSYISGIEKAGDILADAIENGKRRAEKQKEIDAMRGSQ